MTDVFDLEIRYAPELEVAKKHLSSNGKNAGRSQLGPEKIQHLYDNNADCPICGITFEGGNHNTEHIFPIALGGKNTMDNKIQLCVLCNNSRNQVMQAIIGNSPRSKYPDNWIQIKKTLLWHLITIDDGIRSGEAISTPHEKFMQYRTGGSPFPNRPNRAYGRFSTWKIGDPPNYLHNHPQKNRIPSQKAPSQSLTLSVFDWIFGYKSKDKPKPKKVETSRVKTTPIPIEPDIEITEANPPATTVALPKSTDSHQEFRKTISDLLIGLNPTMSTDLGELIAEYQNLNTWEELGTGAFLVHFGFGRNYGLLKAIEKVMGDAVVISGSHPAIRIELILKGNNYPLVPRFNSASAGGLCLPRHPHEFSSAIKEYHAHHSQINTTQDLIDLLLPKLGEKGSSSMRRTHRMIGRLAHLLLQNDESDFKSKDWSQAKISGTPKDLVEAFHQFLLNKEKQNGGINLRRKLLLESYFSRTLAEFAEDSA